MALITFACLSVSSPNRPDAELITVGTIVAPPLTVQLLPIRDEI